MPRFVTSDFVSLAYTIGLLVVVAGILFTLYRAFMQVISTTILWVLFGLTLVGCYSYRSELLDVGGRLFAGAIPANTISHGAAVTDIRIHAGDFAVRQRSMGRL